MALHVHHPAVLMAVTAIGTGCAAQAAAAAGPSQPNQRFMMTARTTNGKDGPLRVRAWGVIDDRGLFRIADRRRTSSGVFRLGHGTVRIRFVHGRITVHPDPAACRVSFEDRGGSFTIRGGTGRYAHASGHGTYVEKRLLVGARSSSGACLLSPTSPVPPRLATSVDHLTGTLRLQPQVTG